MISTFGGRAKGFTWSCSCGADDPRIYNTAFERTIAAHIHLLQEAKHPDDLPSRYREMYYKQFGR